MCLCVFVYVCACVRGASIDFFGRQFVGNRWAGKQWTGAMTVGRAGHAFSISKGALLRGLR